MLSMATAWLLFYVLSLLDTQHSFIPKYLFSENKSRDARYQRIGPAEASIGLLPYLQTCKQEAP